MQDLQKKAFPKRVWRFDPRRLQPGDVVLERGHKPQSKAIMLLDGGDYSHVLFWMGGTDFLEAAGTGVRVISFARVLVLDPNDWLVLRLPDGEAVATAAAGHARNLAHKFYDLIGVMNTKIPVRNEEKPAASICSQVAAASYQRAGEALVPGVSSSKVTPAQLQRKSKLVRVCPTPLEELDLSDPDTAQMLTPYLNRHTAYADSAPNREMKISQKAFKAIRPMFASVIAPTGGKGIYPPGNLADVIDLLAMLDVSVATPISNDLTNILQKQGYFNIADEGVDQTIRRLTVESQNVENNLLTVEEVEVLFGELRRRRRGTLNAWDRHAQNAAICSIILSKKNLLIYEKLRDMHKRYADGFTTIRNLELKLNYECHQFLVREVSKLDKQA